MTPRVAAAAILTLGLLACTEGPRPLELPTVLDVATVRERQPITYRGVAVVVDDNLVITAAHVVDGQLRSLQVGGADAEVVLIDPERDLAVITVDVPHDSVAAVLRTAAPERGESVELITPDGAESIDIDRHITWRLDTLDAASRERVTYRRDAVVFAPAVPTGTSGAPLLDATGHLVGVVIATASGETFAVTADEVQQVLTDAESRRSG